MAKKKARINNKVNNKINHSWWASLAGNELLLVGLAALLAVVGLVLMFLESM